MPRRKVFISYHRTDTDEVRAFVEAATDTHDIFIHRAAAMMPQDIIDSDDTDYVMRRVREDYLEDSTVTLVLVGRCTWARRFCDWEIQSSLRSGPQTTPNGLLGIVLPSAAQNPIAPNRLSINLGTQQALGYARWYHYPQTADALTGWIEDAFAARTSRTNLIVNPRERFANNRAC